MGQLSKLPNIGKIVEEQLIQVGISTLDELKNIDCGKNRKMLEYFEKDIKELINNSDGWNVGD